MPKRTHKPERHRRRRILLARRRRRQPEPSLRITPEQSENWRSPMAGRRSGEVYNQGLPKLHHLGEGDKAVPLEFLIAHGPSGCFYRATVALDSFTDGQNNWAVRRSDGMMYVPQSQVHSWASISS